MMQKQEFHGIPHGLMNTFGVRPDFHVVRNRRRTGRDQFRSAFHFDEAHPTAAFNSDIRVITVTRDQNTNFVRNLNDRFAFFSLVYLAVNGDLGHKQLA
jgi:hypothetical protein